MEFTNNTPNLISLLCKNDRDAFGHLQLTRKRRFNQSDVTYSDINTSRNSIKYYNSTKLVNIFSIGNTLSKEILSICVRFT